MVTFFITNQSRSSAKFNMKTLHVYSAKLKLGSPLCTIQFSSTCDVKGSWHPQSVIQFMRISCKSYYYIGVETGGHAAPPQPFALLCMALNTMALALSFLRL